MGSEFDVVDATIRQVEMSKFRKVSPICIITTEDIQYSTLYKKMCRNINRKPKGRFKK